MHTYLKEIGCQDFTAPPYTWMKRDGQVTTIGCNNNDYTWQLKCVASNWIGSTGNCTNQIKGNDNNIGIF